ncbi:MAG: hypothetical protein H6709_24935 [Kofleriaceae bacterium]|nr:hypothetical protein [Kofleriaceae bacterium]MCB9575335.1 hypothetical protein [Kofleriaceae bacterium]
MALERCVLLVDGMGHPLRCYYPGVVYEITSRTIQERFLLRPGPRSAEIIVGVLARGLELHPEVALHAFNYQSDHYHMMMSSSDGARLSRFLGFVNGRVASEMGRLHGWRGPFWARRARVVPTTDDKGVIERLRYVIGQGVKEGLVASPRDWPGASSTSALLGDMTVEGVYFDRDAETRARRYRALSHPLEFSRKITLRLTPIPPWAHLSADELRARHVALVAGIEATALPQVVGPARLQRVDPLARPAQPARSPAPLCHASDPAMRRAYRSFYRRLCAAFRALSSRVRAGETVERDEFPPGSFPPNLAFIRPSEGARPPWLELAATGTT